MSQLPEIPTVPPEYLEPDYQLPDKYAETYIVLMIRDPQHIFTYWEIAEETMKNFIQDFGPNSWEETRLSLRLSWPNFQQIMEINERATNWHIYLGEKGIPIQGELGRLLADNTFITLAISNCLANFKLCASLNIRKLKDNQLLQQTFDSWEPGISSF